MSHPAQLRLATVPCTVGLLLAMACPAQIGGDGRDGALEPVADLVLDTSTRPGGVFQFTRITIPAGVTLRLVGDEPAVLRSQGAVDVAGTIDADGFAAVDALGGEGGPGGAAGGHGGPWGSVFCAEAGQGNGGGGAGCVQPFSVPQSGGPAGHATPGQQGLGSGGGRAYGSAYPFDLEGGSGAGGTAYPSSFGQLGPGGGGGGGVVAILADEAVVVSGTVRVRGADLGSAGSVLLRSLASVRVHGLIDAGGNSGGPPPLFPRSGDGFVRLDAYGDAPTVTGTVRGVVVTRTLPELTALAAPRLGAPWSLTSATVPGDQVVLLAAAATASVALPRFGVLRLDPSAGLLIVASATTATAGIDPLAELSLAIPPLSALIGSTLHVQAINAVTATGRPRLTNLVSGTIGT
ncbi:MAG: hypothetical protein AAF628_35400 [Planctomycetota bacterium]